MISRFFVEEKMQWQHHRQHKGTQNGHDAQVQAYEFLSVVILFFGGTEVEKKPYRKRRENYGLQKKGEKVSLIWERWSRMMGLIIYFSTKVTKLPCTNMHWYCSWYMLIFSTKNTTHMTYCIRRGFKNPPELHLFLVHWSNFGDSSLQQRPTI